MTNQPMAANQIIDKNNLKRLICQADRHRSKHSRWFRKSFIFSVLSFGMALLLFIGSCDTQREELDWMNEDNMSISQYLDKNQNEYSKFYRLLKEGKMLSTLYAYNPYGEDYTLFVPTDDAIDQFISKNNDYKSFEELLADTSFIKVLTRYHTINRKLNTDEFPDGALNDLTLTGERLVTGFYADGNNQLIKVNNTAPITVSNLKMTNGYIHVISAVLEKPELSGYDWLQQQAGYSILAQAVKLANVKSRLWWKKYTIFAEHDSIYRRRGINTVDDLVKRIATPGLPISDKNNDFFIFAAYHFMGDEYYLNDLTWGSKKYVTLSGKYIPISVGTEIRINDGIDTYRYSISSSGDTTLIDYILPFWKYSNTMTLTGPAHSISDVMHYEPLPKSN
jgi:uncharacterized surface protein with fasciclin (FAS1) repeats